jgi:hypothetical protein
MASPSPPPYYNNSDTFGEDFVNEYKVIDTIKNILKKYENNIKDRQYYLNKLKDEYIEMLSNSNVSYKSGVAPEDMFNELVAQAKLNPFDTSDFRGGKSKRSKSKRSKTKRSGSKTKRSGSKSKRSGSKRKHSKTKRSKSKRT